MSESAKNQSRRKLLKQIAAGSGAAITAKQLPDKWIQPATEGILLPAHAQMFGPQFLVRGIYRGTQNPAGPFFSENNLFGIQFPQLEIEVEISDTTIFYRAGGDEQSFLHGLPTVAIGDPPPTALISNGDALERIVSTIVLAVAANENQVVTRVNGNTSANRTITINSNEENCDEICAFVIETIATLSADVNSPEVIGDSSMAVLLQCLIDCPSDRIRDFVRRADNVLIFL